jgi:chromosome segregation ATPase
MCKNVVILSIACALVLCIASIAQDRVPVKDELQKRFDKNKDGFIDGKEQGMLQKFEQTKERVEKLRVMAREAEEKAKNFRAEAEELQRNMEREFELPPAGGQVEQMHAELAGLKEAAERAQREGQPDKAAELREKAKRMANEIEIHQRELQEGKRVELKEQLGRLEKMVREAEEQGEEDKAKRLRAEAEKVGRQMEREFKLPPMAPHTEQMHARLVELKEAYERAEREGQHDKAAELRKEAEKLERSAREMTEGREEGTRERDLIYQIEKLREEVGRLRKDIEELKRLSHQPR